MIKERPTWINTFFFFFNDTATTEIYTLSLHDALPIWRQAGPIVWPAVHVLLMAGLEELDFTQRTFLDRKSTRLNSSHLVISYAVFCLKKKKNSLKCTREVSVRDYFSHIPTLTLLLQHA